MPIWIHNALLILYGLWTFEEAVNLVIVLFHPTAKYNRFGRIKLLIWIITTVFVLSYYWS